MVFNFKRKMHSWLKETNEDDTCSKALSRVIQVDLQKEVQN